MTKHTKTLGSGRVFFITADMAFLQAWGFALLGQTDLSRVHISPCDRTNLSRKEFL